ncbi:MAG: hypothetical protein JSS82_15830 [Bacteroidetes bacterium]|nr:hypothetical protein [Bacteroidota bacterium]
MCSSSSLNSSSEYESDSSSDIGSADSSVFDDQVDYIYVSSTSEASSVTLSDEEESSEISVYSIDDESDDSVLGKRGIEEVENVEEPDGKIVSDVDGFDDFSDEDPLQHFDPRHARS